MKVEKNMKQTRKQWLDLMVKIVDPVLTNIANDNLKKNMPKDKNRDCSYLEAFGRTLMGIAYWLETPQVDEEEEALRRKYVKLAQLAIDHATNPNSADYLPFYLSHNRQPLVDAAFLAEAIIRAPKMLWTSLDERVKTQVITEMKKTREIEPYLCNWILFSGTIEAFFKMVGEPYELSRVEFAVTKMEEWYVGDSIYKDGDVFHFDYYNSYVIYPMLIDITTIFKNENELLRKMNEIILKRAKRYAEIQERMIMSDGSFPIVGRSIAYRAGTFQLLSQIAYLNQLPECLSKGQVRCALTAVLNKVFSTNNFDDLGYLEIGLYGKQPSLGEGYITQGSLYLTTAVFLVLGLPETDEFWTSDDDMWTSVKVWNGFDVKNDHAKD